VNNTKKRNQIGKKKIKRVWLSKFQVCGGKKAFRKKKCSIIDGPETERKEHRNIHALRIKI